MILTDMEIGGRTRKVIMQAPKSGFFYVLDRVIDELLSAEKDTTVTWAGRVDLKTGRPVIRDESDFSKETKLVWPPMAYSDQTKLVYIPVLETPMTFAVNPMPYKPYSIVQGVQTGLSAFALADEKGLAPILKGQPKPRFEQVLKDWDPAKQKHVWSSKVMPF